MTDYPFTPLIRELPSTVPFVGPEAQERTRGRPFVARLGANESVFGPSPRAIEMMAKAAADVWMYGDPENRELREALAAHHNVTPDNVTVGEGIDGLIHVLCQMCVEPGAKVVTTGGGYPTFNFHVAGHGGELVTVPFKDDREDVEVLVVKAAEVGAKLVYHVNPGNPMGTWHDVATLRRAIEALPQGALLILDEAYYDFLPEDARLPLDVNDRRLIRMRTFSKAYGMAGARIGYALGEQELIKGFDKVRNHFGVNRVAQDGALAALADQTYLKEVVAQVNAAKARIGEIAAENGLSVLPSATNFVAMDCGGDDTRARAVLAGLVERDIFVRMPWVAPQTRCIRVSAGTPSDLDAFATALKDVLTTL